MDYINSFCEILKQKFVKTGFVKEEDINNYGFSDIKTNLFMEMSEKTKKEYENGDGKELEKDDIKRIRSSAAMIYNLLGNGNVSIINNKDIPGGVYSKEFEKKYQTVDVKIWGKQVEANLDAWLYNSNCEIFIESKCLEWLQNSQEKELKKSYIKNTRRYFHKDTAETFRSIGCEISFSQYDSCQMFKHTLAIYNYIKDHPETKGKKIYLINIVWEPDSLEIKNEKYKKQYEEQITNEHKQFSLFHEKMIPIIELIRKEIENEFDILYMSVKDFHSILNYSDEKQKQFVQRYL